MTAPEDQAFAGRTAKDLHRDAMGLVMQGFMARMKREPDTAMLLFRQALDLERAAIRALEQPPEPTRSILYRSAGWMAVHCGQYDTAISLVLTGLAGSPPADIAAELNELLAAPGLSRMIRPRAF